MYMLACPIPNPYPCRKAVKIMTSVPTSVVESSLGFKARKLRISQLLTQKELAGMAGVSTEEVELLERNLPLPLDSKRKILKELWARKSRG